MQSSWLASFCVLAAFNTAAAAQQCWRNTPCTGPSAASFPGPWDNNNFSPASRTATPVRILDQNHNVISQWPGRVTLNGNGAMRILDFGKEIGGVLSIEYSACGVGSLGLSFSEASNFTGYRSDESNGGSGPDGALSTPINANPCVVYREYRVPDAQQRGGFRYLTLFAQSDGANIQVNVNKISVEISFQPTWSNLRAYQGYFHSSDQLLNRIWYAGAYTIQTTAVPSNTGREFPLVNVGWKNDAQLGTSAPTVLVDGAKRDRAIWSGDLGVATRSALVSTGDLESVKSALQVQYQYQRDSGELPMVGPPINFFSSDTYHMSTLIGTYDYMVFSGDTAFLNSNWGKYKSAVSFVTNKIDGTGMMNVNGPNNWGRTAGSGGHATDGNMLLYRTLVTGAIMAKWQGENNLSTSYSALADKVKNAVNQNNWDSGAGAFKNTDQDGSIHPEDGNSMALYYGGTSPAYMASASAYLKTNWGPVGAVTPELPGNVVPYIESFEIKAHLAARQPQRALDLMRLSWGWYLNNPFGTQSTFLEGYFTDGSFRYRDDGYNKGGAYTSHAHGWSTGPTDALTSHVVGLQPTGLGGKTWLLEPQFGDLSFAQAGFAIPAGKFSASWNVTGTGYIASVDVPASTTGTARLPFTKSGKKPNSVKVNGHDQTYTVDNGARVITFSIAGGKSDIVVAS